MTLHVRAVVASRGLDVELTLEPGERLAVLGPNGAGKSTLLAVLAGVLRPDAGRVELDGRVLLDRGAGRTREVPPHDRGVALMAQDPLLFPHLRVLDNVAFGPRSAGAGRAAARAAARRWLGEVEMTGYADRRPGQLSGGQAQRVALARALAAEPRLLLLDEPMAALDVAAAPLLRSVLRRVLAGRSTVLVTHDLLDALLLASRVVVLDSGRVVESGPTVEVVRHPRTAFTARVAGLNLVEGTATPRGLRTASGQLVEGLAREPTPVGAAAVAVFSPSAVAVHDAAPHGSPRNVVPVTVTALEPREDLVRVRAVTGAGQALVADVTAPAVGELDLHPGRAVHYAVKATAVTVYRV